MDFLPRDNTYDSWLSNPVDKITQVQETLERLQKCMYNTSPTRYSAMDPDTVTTNTTPIGIPVNYATRRTGIKRNDDGSAIDKSTTTNPNLAPLTIGNVNKHNRSFDKFTRSKSAPNLTKIDSGHLLANKNQ